MEIMIKTHKKERGEIATVLTILSFALMLAGIAVGSITTQKQTRLLTKAATDQCAVQDIIDKKYLGKATEEGINGCICDETNRQKVVMHKSCDCAATGACPYVYPEKDTENYCSGKITCKFENSAVTPLPTKASCATGEWSCKGQCADKETQELFNNTWCSGEKRWLYEAAGANAECQGETSIPKSDPACTGGTSSSPATNPARGPSPGNLFHLTSDIYAEKTTDGIKFNVHVLFNFDGCDGDIQLFRDGTRVAGYNAWKGPGGFDYDQQWAGSFTLKKGESISPGYKGTVDRCPKSKVMLEDNISCKLAVDYSGNPGVFGAGCNFKDQANFPAYNPASPTLGAPSGVGGKYRCQDLTDSPNKDCSDTMAGPCEYGTWKYKCTNTACPSDKSVGVGIPFWCDGDKWFDTNKLGECTNACTAPGATAPSPSSECSGKADGFVISGCTQQECETVNKKWINAEKICQGGVAYTKPGKLSADACNPQTEKFRACPAGAAGAVGASGTTGPTTGTGVTKQVKVKYKVQGLCNLNLPLLNCPDDYDNPPSKAEMFVEKIGSGTVKTVVLNYEAFNMEPGWGSRQFFVEYPFELNTPYNATLRFHYKSNGVMCYNDKEEKNISFTPANSEYWWVTMNIDRSQCGTALVTPAAGQNAPATNPAAAVSGGTGVSVCKDANKSDQPCPAGPYQQNDCAGTGPCWVTRTCGAKNNDSCTYTCKDKDQKNVVPCWPGQNTQQNPAQQQPAGGSNQPTCSSLGGRCFAGTDRPFNPLCLKELLPPPAKGCGDGNGYIGPIAIGCYQCPNFKISTSSTNQAFQTAVDLYSQQKVTAKDISEFVSKLPNNSDLPAPHIKYCDPTKGECNLPEGPQPGSI